MPDLAWDTLRADDRIHPTPTKQQQTALDKLQAQFEEIDDENDEAYEKLAAKIDKLESEFAFTAEAKAASGANVTISAEGELEIISGLVRREDRAAAKKTEPDAAEGDAAKAPPCFSSKLIEDLTAHRTAALRAMLAQNPKVALAAVVHAMALGVFYDERDASRLQITPRVVSLDRHAEGMDGTEAAKLNYVGRYTHRVAISNNRLVSIDNGKVQFRWRDYWDGNRQKIMTLDGGEFVRRFLVHVLPDGFHRIRYYGFLGNCHRARKLERCRELLGMTPAAPADPPADYRDRYEALTGQSLRACPHCHTGLMVVIDSIARSRVRLPVPDTS